MASSYSIGNLFGIPIRAHVTLLIFLPLFALSFMPAPGAQGLFYGALGAVGLFGSVVLHEVGHSLVARAKGSRILEILLLPIGGMARLDRLPKRPADEIQTALAGPAVSLALGVAGLFGAPFVYPFNPFLAVLGHELGRINVMLVLFNLIPSFPMDGGRVFRAALVPRLGRLAATRIAASVGRGIAWLFGLWALWPLFDGGAINFTLLLIAYFVHQSAGAEARMAEVEAEVDRRRAPSGGIWQLPDADVQVGPPPYARADSRAASRGLFDDLLDKWR
ncbi:MAG: site-2 protease family protein [Kiritimatiellia bacterium]